MPYVRLTEEFFARPCCEVARDLVGKLLCRRMPDGRELRLRILETEAYCGEADTACHAHKGRTSRSEVLYAAPGTLYVYLCYGVHWMLNLVTGEAEDPQAVLIRSCASAEGPGRLTKALSIDKGFNRMTLSRCAETFWVEDDGVRPQVKTAPRVGIGYASPEDQARLWRYILSE